MLNSDYDQEGIRIQNSQRIPLNNKKNISNLREKIDKRYE